MIIYKITNKINGKVYIGQTITSLERRWIQHCSDSKKKSKNMAIIIAIQKYGKENFTIEQIDTANTRTELDQKEAYWIKYYNSLSPNGYNLTTGGIHYEFSDETRKKISNANKGDKNYWYGKRFSTEHKNKIKNKMIGRVFTEEWKQKISESCKGRKLSDDVREKLRLVNTGRKASEETRRKMSNSRKGRIVSEETRKKISEKNKQFFGEKNSRSKKVLCVETGEIFASGNLAAKQYNLSGGISACCRCINRTAGGYHWRFVE